MTDLKKQLEKTPVQKVHEETPKDRALVEPRPDRLHHFDRWGTFEVDQVSGAGIALRQGETLVISYRLPDPMLAEVVTLLNEERAARFAVTVCNETGNGGNSQRGFLGYDADESSSDRAYVFTGHDARRRAVACYEKLAKQGGDIGSSRCRVELLRNGVLIRGEG